MLNPATKNILDSSHRYAPKVESGLLICDNGLILRGQGIGRVGHAVGELCFNTSMTGYQEILSDPSYAGQIITFTFPHIGNVGANPEDIETLRPAARGLLLRQGITPASNWRARMPLTAWLEQHGMVGLTGVNTRALTTMIRDRGAPKIVIAHDPSGQFDEPALRDTLRAWPGLEGLDLAPEVTCERPYEWSQSVWDLKRGYGEQTKSRFHVVAVDFGAKLNILRLLAAHDCRVTVVPAQTSAAEILALKPDGIFLSNGPGDPAATGVYAVPMIRAILQKNLPLFGICLGHQLLGLALGGTTQKMACGHRGANHPVKDHVTGKIEITSQNHGFMVLPETLPDTVAITHTSLFDGSNEGLALKDRPVFSVQYHPEASPGPHDSQYLFARFREMMTCNKAA
jgi:carbamoyl-phosphate synthase small subunit